VKGCRSAVDAAKAVSALLADSAVWFSALFAATWARFDFKLVEVNAGPAVRVAVIAVLVNGAVGCAMGIYRRRYIVASFEECLALATAAAVSSALLLATVGLIQPHPVPRSVPVLAGAFALGGTLAVRWLARTLANRHRRKEAPGRKVVVLGAGRIGQSLARQMERDERVPYRLVALLDDDPAKRHLHVAGVHVQGTRRDLASVTARFDADAVVIAMADPDPELVRDVSAEAALLGIGALVVPPVTQLVGATAIRRVLLIGGAGYIGSALIPKLLDNGYHVRLLDLLIFGTEPIAPWLEHPRLEVIKADFRQVDTVVRAMRNVDAVIHLGAIVGDPACALDEELTVEINLMATRMIAEVAKGSGVGRFIFASTCSVYGASDEILDERSALNPVSLYARSKIACEKVLHKMADDQFAPVIVRFGTVYGLSGRTRFDLVVNLLTAKAVIDHEITVMGGDQWRPFLHVDDAAQAVFMALEAAPALLANQVFNVGADDQNYTISQVGEIIHRLVPTAKLIDLGSDTDRRNYRVSFSHIRRQLGFVPRYTVAQGVQQVLHAFAQGQVTDYRAASYSNVKFLNDGGKAQLVRNENGWATDLLHEAAPPMARAVGA